MLGRRATVEITYNGVSVTDKILDQKTQVTYTDPANGEADSLDITMQDRERQWVTAWLPVGGDTITAAIKVQNWNGDGDSRTLNCGFFTLDNFTFSGWPIGGTISGISTPADDAFQSTPRTKNWENVTLLEIGKEIANRAGITLAWDVEEELPPILAVEQTEKTDCEFYTSLCSDYGLFTKVYAQKIVVYDREAYKAKPSGVKLSESEIKSWNWTRSMDGTYTGGEYTYTDPDTEEEIKATVGTGPRILKVNGKADNQADAERRIKAAVAKENHSATTLSVTIMGRPDIVAATNVAIVGLGRLSGKYFVDKVTSRVDGSGGYGMDLELSLVEEDDAAVVKDSISRLQAAGVINSPDYWVEHYEDVPSLEGLLLNMATRIKVNRGGSSITTVDAALQVLTDGGVINSPDYWAAHHTAVAYMDELLIKAANAMTE